MVWPPSKIRHRRVRHRLVRSDPLASTVTTWVPELCGAPDVPHAVQSASKSSNNASKSLTVDNHVVSPSSSLVSVAVEDEVVCVDIGGGFESVAPELTARSQREPLKVTFRFATPLPSPLSTPNSTVTSAGSIGGGSAKIVNAEWLALLWRGDLYLTVPNGIVIERSKEAFITLLEFAEEKLQCKSIIVCFSKSRTERNTLIRMFMFLGFVMLPPNQLLVPTLDVQDDTLFMAYSIA